MLFSKSCHFVLFFAYLLSADAQTNLAIVDIGTAENYAILAKSGISTTAQSAITGDIAVSPIAGTAITGFSLTLDSDGTSSTSAGQFTGKAYAASFAAPTPSLLTVAVGDMGTAYTNAAGRTNGNADRINLGAGEIGGQTLTPGVYTFGSSVSVNSNVTINGTAEDIFIIQMTGNLMVAANKEVTLSGGAQAKNIFWQVAGNVKVGADAHMEGILLVKTDVTFITGSSLNGRVLAQTACVLQNATIVEPAVVDQNVTIVEPAAVDQQGGRRNLRHHR